MAYKYILCTHTRKLLIFKSVVLSNPVTTFIQLLFFMSSLCVCVCVFLESRFDYISCMLLNTNEPFSDKYFFSFMLHIAFTVRIRLKMTHAFMMISYKIIVKLILFKKAFKKVTFFFLNRTFVLLIYKFEDLKRSISLPRVQNFVLFGMLLRTKFEPLGS